MTDDTAEHTGRRIEDEITIRSPPEAAWAAWADPDELARWFVDQASGRGERGGTMTWAWEAYGLEQELHVVDAEEGQRLVLEVAWTDDTPTLIEVTVHPEAGGTRLRLIHSGFDEAADWDGEYEGARSGWTNALAHLKVYLEDHPGQDKATFDTFQPATYELADVLELTRTPEGLARWFGDAQGPIPAVGEPVVIDLQHGGTLTGEIVSMTDWETAITWEELDGVLTFQAFPGEGDIEHGQRMIGLRVTSWGAPAKLELQGKALEAALSRLVGQVSPGSSQANA